MDDTQPEPQLAEPAHVRVFRQSRSGDFAAAVLVTAPFASWLIHKSALYALPTILALGVGLAWWWMRLGRRVLRLTDEGLEVVTLFGAKRLRWGDAFYAYSPESDASRSQGLIADAAINLVTSAVGLLTRRSKQISTKLSVRDPNGAWVCLDDYAGARSVEPELVSHIHRCSNADTTPFGVSAEEVRHCGERLAFSQLERVVVGAEVVLIDAASRSARASVDLGAVHNIWLLVERLLEHGVNVELAIVAPASIVASVEAVAARQANMPRATIVKQ